MARVCFVAAVALLTSKAEFLQLLIGGGGWALQFDGFDDHVALSGEVGPGGNYTIEFWAYPMDKFDGMGKQVVRNNRSGVILGQQSPISEPGFTILMNGGDVRGKRTSTNNITTRDVNPQSEKPGLYHYAYVQQESQEGASRSIYINGEPANSTQGRTIELPLLPEDLQDSVQKFPWLLGAYYQYRAGSWTTADSCFGGIIDELRWWNTARTLNEIKRFMLRPVSDDAVGLVKQWHFDEGHGSSDGERFFLGSGDISKQPQWVPSPVNTLGGPVALATRVGDAAQTVELCAMLTAAGSHSSFGLVESATLNFLTAPTMGSLKNTTISLLEHVAGRFCGEAVYTPKFAGFEETYFEVQIVVDGATISAMQKLAVRILPNSAPVAGAIHYEILEGTCGNFTLRASDAEGDNVTYSVDNVTYSVVLHDGNRGFQSLVGDQLDFCAPVGQRVDINVSYDVCDHLGLCASSSSGVGTVVFHVLTCGPSIKFVQIVPSNRLIRVVFDMETNAPNMDHIGCDHMENPQDLIALYDSRADSFVEMSAGYWEAGNRILQLFPKQVQVEKWIAAFDLHGGLPEDWNHLSVRVLRAASLRDANQTSFPSESNSSNFSLVTCGDGLVLLPDEDICSPCPSGRQPQWVEGALLCIQCSAGTYRAMGGDLFCKACPKGSYLNDSAVDGNSTACILCPSMMTTGHAGAVTAEACICEANSYRDRSVPGGCVSCGLLHRTKAAGASSSEECFMDRGFQVLIIAIVVGTCGGLTLLMIVLCFVRRRYKRRVQQLELQHTEHYHKRIEEAFLSMSTLEHPMVLVRADIFLQLGQLIKHETLRGEGKLVSLNTLEEVASFKEKNFILFVSHQWLAWGRPDPQQVHYHTICAAVCSITGCENMSGNERKERLSAWYVWCDFASIPQMHPKIQSLAITCLPLYACMAHAFVVIAPMTKHGDTEMTCDLHSYVARGWCRAEILSKLCGSGLHHLYVVQETSGKVMSMTDDFCDSLDLSVFNGNFSCCHRGHQGTDKCDKEKLVAPMLALYSLLLRQKAKPYAKPVLSRIQKTKEQFFPARFSFSNENGDKADRELFGPMAQMMEDHREQRYELQSSATISESLLESIDSSNLKGDLSAKHISTSSAYRLAGSEEVIVDNSTHKGKWSL